MKLDPFRKPRWWQAHSFVLVTGSLFALSWLGQFVFQAMEFAGEASQHGEAFEWSAYWPSFLAATMENWQSEFLQAAWTAFALGCFYSWGSSQSREQTDRLEAKVDALLSRFEK